MLSIIHYEWHNMCVACDEVLAFWCVWWAHVVFFRFGYKRIRTLLSLFLSLSLSTSFCCLFFRSCSPSTARHLSLSVCLPFQFVLLRFLFWLILFFTQITAEHTQQIKLRVCHRRGHRRRRCHHQRYLTKQNIDRNTICVCVLPLSLLEIVFAAQISEVEALHAC